MIISPNLVEAILSTEHTATLHFDHFVSSPLKGVIGEKLLKTLPPSVKTVRLHPKAVMTPLGKEALRKRGITIDRGTKP